MKNMKALILMTVFVCLLLTIASAESSYAGDNGIGVIIDGVPVQFNDDTGYPFIDSNGRTMVPLRAPLEAYGCTVEWDQFIQSITIHHPFSFGEGLHWSEYLYIGRTHMLAPNPQVLDSVPIIIKGRTYLPIRAVFEGFYADVYWDSVDKSVVVYRDERYYGPNSSFGLSTFKKISYKYPDPYSSRTTWTWSNEYSDKVYESYKNMDRTLLNYGFEDYVKSNRSYQAVHAIAYSMEKAAKERNYNDVRTINLVVAFVQNIKYVSDNHSTAGRAEEYYKFPFETLYENAGDCEDTSFLLYSILEDMGYECALMVYPGHMAVGVALTDVAEGEYVYYNGTRFYYIETTASGWKVGEIPEDLQGVYPIVYGYGQSSATTLDGKYYAYYSSADGLTVQAWLGDAYLLVDTSTNKVTEYSGGYSYAFDIKSIDATKIVVDFYGDEAYYYIKGGGVLEKFEYSTDSTGEKRLLSTITYKKQ